MKDPIKLKINPTTNQKTYEFAINLGIPPGENKPFTTRRRGFVTRKEAINAYHLLKAQAANGVFLERKYTFKEESVDVLTKYSTVSEYFPTYWDWYLAGGNESTTNDKTYGYFKNHILPAFGDMKLNEITVMHCKEFAIEVISKLKTSCRQILLYFKKFMEDVKISGLILENPMENVNIPTASSLKRKNQKGFEGEEDVFEGNFYDKEELLTFQKYAKIYFPSNKYTFFSLLIASGMRRGEAIALRWSDLNFEESYVNIQKSAAYSTEKKLHLKKTKNGLSRKIKIDKQTLNQLMLWKQTQKEFLITMGYTAKPDNAQFIFQNKFNELTSPSRCGDWLKRFYKKAPTMKKITVHGFRHTHCTLGIKSSSFTPKEMSMRLGHTSTTFTLDIYDHLMYDSLTGNPAAFMDYLEM